MFNVNNSQDANTIDIKNYVVRYKGYNGSSIVTQTATLTPTNTGSNASNDDVRISGLLPNVRFDEWTFIE